MGLVAGESGCLRWLAVQRPPMESIRAVSSREVERSQARGESPKRTRAGRFPALVVQLWWQMLFGSVGLDLGYRPDGIADLEAGKAAHAEVLTQFADLLRDQVLDGKGLILDEGLVEQANFFVKLAHLAFHDLFDYLGRLTRSRSLRAVNILLPLQILGGDIFAANIARVSGRDVHRDVLQQLLKILR